MDHVEYYEQLAHDPKDPNPWLTLYLDPSLPLPPDVKAMFLRSCSSWSRQYLLPCVRLWARITIFTQKILKIFWPNFLTSSALYHWLCYQGMKWWVMPEANTLILRHMHVGTEILGFLRSNVKGVEISANPLRPKNLEAVKDHLYLEHDLNLFNFIIELGRELKTKGIDLVPPEELNFDCITDAPFEIEEMPNRFTNFIDLETAIEIYTPLFQALLTDRDFWRSCHSLQLDETIGIYVGAILGNTSHLGLVNNRHPLVPLELTRAGFRLMLHGLSAEILHSMLVRCKRAQAAGEALPVYRGAYMPGGSAP